VKRTITKAWRFEGEMREIATTFQGAQVPYEFYEAAAKIYHRMAKLKTSEPELAIDEILRAIATETE
jgi:hypothetical protein